MTSDDKNAGARAEEPVAARGGRHSTAVVIGAAVAGLALGALAVFALAGVTWKIRVELPQPPYPQVSSTPTVSLVPPTITYTTTIPPPTTTSVRPAPPFPPGPHALGPLTIGAPEPRQAPAPS